MNRFVFFNDLKIQKFVIALLTFLPKKTTLLQILCFLHNEVDCIKRLNFTSAILMIEKLLSYSGLKCFVTIPTSDGGLARTSVKTTITSRASPRPSSSLAHRLNDAPTIPSIRPSTMTFPIPWRRRPTTRRSSSSKSLAPLSSETRAGRRKRPCPSWAICRQQEKGWTSK